MPAIIQKPEGSGKISSNIRMLIERTARQDQMISNGVMTSRTTRGTTRSTQLRRPQPISKSAPVVTDLVARWS
jgi:hypothetical protein